MFNMYHTHIHTYAYSYFYLLFSVCYLLFALVCTISPINVNKRTNDVKYMPRQIECCENCEIEKIPEKRLTECMQDVSSERKEREKISSDIQLMPNVICVFKPNE